MRTKRITLSGCNFSSAPTSLFDINLGIEMLHNLARLLRLRPNSGQIPGVTQFNFSDLVGFLGKTPHPYRGGPNLQEHFYSSRALLMRRPPVCRHHRPSRFLTSICGPGRNTYPNIMHETSQLVKSFIEIQPKFNKLPRLSTEYREIFGRFLRFYAQVL